MSRIKRFWEGHRAFLSHPVFLGLLAAKLACSFLFASDYFVRERFLAFVRYFVDSGFSDPWAEFLRRGLTDAFPYSSMMLAVLALPQALAAPLFGGAHAIPAPLAFALLRLPLLAADVFVYLVLCRLFETKWRYVLGLHWCSPVLFYISYVHGQLDAIPTAFLFASLVFALRLSPWRAGALLGAGLATKFHLAVAFPLIGLFLYRAVGPADRSKLVGAFLFATAATAAVLLGPLCLSEGYRALVLGAKEINWVYGLTLAMPRGVNILLCPAALIVLVLHFFSFKNTTRDILILYIGLVYTVLIVLVPPMPGWAYWSLPFLTYFLIRQEVSNYLPFWLYTAAYLVYFLGFEPKTAVVRLDALLPEGEFARLRDVAFTAMQTSLLLVAAWIYRLGVRAYARYRDLRKTVTIGIGGDSGVGKNTLAQTLADLLGSDGLVFLHGDDYHRWPRGHESWQTLTHLDPQSNYFQEPLRHLESLRSGIPVMKKSYDHKVGDFTAPARVEPGRMVVFEGLHPFVFKRMRDLFDIKAFICADEPLRRRWKIQRDCVERGHAREAVLQEIERRGPDSDRYVQPQAKFADWVIEYYCASPGDPGAEPAAALDLRVRHTVSSDVVEIEKLTEELRREGGESLQVLWRLEPDLERQALEVVGPLSAEAVARIAYRIFPRLADFVPGRPVWQSGVKGLNQIVFLTLLQRRLEG
ncbi:MAG: hypothetical protein A2X36_17345 [Elusimicrobia bacterium GWA2_69_24]|nr:MAG: hypothetical protein A2X36_17345 [Elusimicrobia bacterium GWA2_69_24]HBL17919.1 hypothetical protein [Elusimicrobiota bacterium]